MNKTLGTFAVIQVLMLTACSHNAGNSNVVTKDTLIYTYQTIKEQQTDCRSKIDQECTIVKIKYPVFKSYKNLNDSLQSFIINHNLLVFNGQSSTSITQSAKKYANEVNALLKKPDPGLASPDFIRLDIGLIRQDSGLLAIRINDDGYSYKSPVDKPAPSERLFTYFINWDIKRNRNILLKDILITNYDKNLDKIAEAIFLKNEGLSDTTSLLNKMEAGRRYYKFNPGELPLSNFLITQSGLRFKYNPFDIKPFDAGQTDLFIPYSSIKHLLRPNTVINQYIK